MCSGPFVPVNLVALVSCILAVGSGSCSGTNGSTCADFVACGGAITPGTYKIGTACMSSSPTDLELNCAQPGTIQITEAETTGTVTLNADMTYTSIKSGRGTAMITVPAACLKQGAVQHACSDLESDFKGQGIYDTVKCTGSSDCTCTATFAMTDQSQSGTYSTSGSTLMTKASGNEPEGNEYCASGTSLTTKSSLSFGERIRGSMSVTMVQTLTKQ